LSRDGLRLLLAAAAATAPASAAAAPAKPPSADEISDYRSRAYPVCLRINPLVAPGGAVNEDAIEQCWCSLDRLIAEGRIDDLRGLEASNARATLGPAIAACRAGEPMPKPRLNVPPSLAQADEIQRDAREALEASRRDAEALVARTERVKAADPARAEADKPPAAGPPWEAPSWLAWSGLPGWAVWLVGGFAALAGLVLLLTRRRRGGRGDLIAPPPSLRGEPPRRG
jgi:hypothetical protein